MPKARTIQRKRFFVIFAFFTLILGCLAGRLFYIQFIRGQDLQQMAVNNRMREVEVKAKRGTIYDRNGSELAISLGADTVYAIPPEVRKSGQGRETARQLSRILKINETKLYRKITGPLGFTYVKRKVSYDQARTIKNLKLPGIHFFEESRRFYPKETLAAHVLGITNIDNQGIEGIDRVYNQELSGRPGYILVEYDSRGRELPQDTHRYIPPVDGQDLYLTIDERIQYVVERELDQVVYEHHPKQATAIVMDPQTGEILALANRPVYNPNQKYDDFPPVTHRNNAISNAYEPGSTFKIVTASAALEEALVRPDERFYDPGFIMVGKRKIRCWKPEGHGSQTFTEVAQNSCNPGFIQIGQRLGLKRFYTYLRAFGFGQKTGISLPGEAVGILVPEGRAKDLDLATMSIGQANAVTPMQIVTAVSAVANGGTLMSPLLVREISTKNKMVHKVAPSPVREVISAETSRTVRDILEQVVSKGTGNKAYLEGYRVAGKTGTAQKIRPGGGYEPGKFVASFIGFAPADNPRATLLVIIDEPQGNLYQGGLVAAPVFKNIMQETLRILEVAPQINPGTLKDNATALMVPVPDVTGMKTEGARRLLQKSGFDPVVEGPEGVVREQNPKGTAQVTADSTVILYSRPDKAVMSARPGQPTDVMVPDLQGRTMREATELLVAAGLKIKPQGSGIAVTQSVQPGETVQPGTVITVEFSAPGEETVAP